MTKLNKYLCPVCGYDQLETPPKDEFGCSTFEICPCCGTEFGYDDSNKSYLELRKEWVNAGAKWFSDYNRPSEGWNPYKQLKKVGFINEK